MDTTLWAELLTYGMAGASPIHIVPCCCCCCWPLPIGMEAGLWHGWVVTTLAGAILLALTPVELAAGPWPCVLDMSHGSHHRTGLDLRWALVAVLGGHQLIGSGPCCW